MPAPFSPSRRALMAGLPLATNLALSEANVSAKKQNKKGNKPVKPLIVAVAEATGHIVTAIPTIDTFLLYYDVSSVRLPQPQDATFDKVTLQITAADFDRVATLIKKRLLTIHGFEGESTKRVKLLMI